MLNFAITFDNDVFMAVWIKDDELKTILIREYDNQTPYEILKNGKLTRAFADILDDSGKHKAIRKLLSFAIAIKDSPFNLAICGDSWDAWESATEEMTFTDIINYFY